MLSLLRQIVAAATVVCLSPLAANAADCHIERTTAEVNFIVDKRTWFPVHADLAVPGSARISIGPRGHVTVMTERRCTSNPVGRTVP
tara:strand:+ start:20426 stop:20686 length:261 start_codon:yes stop_codon:yes gene_type:complete